MARSKLPLPQTFSFSTTIPIRITDLNYGNHVGNDTVLSLLHEARMQFLKSLTYTEFQLAGVGLIMSDVTIEFKAEVFYGDVINAYVTAGEFSRVGFELYYKLMKSGTETIVAVAKTGMVCFDYEKKKVVSLPAEAAKRLRE
jgi:YbgC/YbaW family acyl-CoA thioester hydrolase